MKTPFLKNLFAKKENELVEKSVFDEQVNATRRILVREAISSRLRTNLPISLDWVKEYNDLTTLNSQPLNTLSLEQDHEKFLASGSLDVATLSQEDFDKSIISSPIPQTELDFEEPKRATKTKKRYTSKQINKVFKQVIKDVEQGVSVAQAIENTGFPKGSFYVKISDYQKGKLKRTRLRANLIK